MNLNSPKIFSILHPKPPKWIGRWRLLSHNFNRNLWLYICRAAERHIYNFYTRPFHALWIQLICFFFFFFVLSREHTAFTQTDKIERMTWTMRSNCFPFKKKRTHKPIPVHIVRGAVHRLYLRSAQTNLIFHCLINNTLNYFNFPLGFYNWKSFSSSVVFVCVDVCAMMSRSSPSPLISWMSLDALSSVGISLPHSLSNKLFNSDFFFPCFSSCYVKRLQLIF